MSRMAETVVGMQRQHEGLPSLADVPGSLICVILSRVHSTIDRNRASEVCRSFRFYERHTRSYLCVRGIQRHLGFVPLCFSNVIDLDLSWLTLFADEVPTFKFERARLIRIARAFPNVLTLKVMTMSDESVREIGLIWPQIVSISFAQQKDVSTIPHLKSVLETFKYCEVLDARNILCTHLADVLLESESLSLKSLNLETLVIRTDEEIDLLAEKCPSLESLSITVDPGRVMGYGLLNLAKNCRKLSKLRLFLYLDPIWMFDVETARKCLNSLATMASELPDLENYISFQHIPPRVTGNRMECLLGMASSIRSLVVYATEVDMKGLSSCNNLAELTIGACESISDLDLVSIITKCPKLHTLRLLNCKRITQRGLRETARIAKLTSLSLCFLKIPVKAQVDAVKPLSGSLTAMRLMVNGPVDSLSGLSGWPNLDRLELTFTSSVRPDTLQERWLESCPNLRHLGLVCENWNPSTLCFLSMLPSLPSLSLSFSRKVKKDLLLSFLEEISLLPQLSTLSLFISNEEWLSEEAGTVLATCPKLKNLNIIWDLEGPPEDRQFDVPDEDWPFNIRPFLLQLLVIKCLQNVQLPAFLIDETDLKIFHQGLHAHTMQSLLRSIYDLQAKDSKPAGRKNTILHRREQTVL